MNSDLLPACRRRQALQIMATGAGLGLLGRAAQAEVKPYVWRGIALGAPASITLYHADARLAQQTLTAVETEIHRLEQEFSLYRPVSALSRLNRQGSLEQPSLDMLRLLSEAQSISALTQGVFDISVQPLWAFYRNAFNKAAMSPSDSDGLASVLRCIDYRAIDVQASAIRLQKPGMALTLNGIAQGYITDRIADRLRAAGFAHVLLDLGEIRALGTHPGGRAWRVGLTDPMDKTRLIEQLTLSNQALATSAGAGHRFEPTGRYHHLFDPHSGQSRQYYDSVSVSAPSATLADALATALYQIPPRTLQTTLAPFAPVRAVLRQASGQMLRFAL